jgi:hypothetical protein
VVGGRLREGEDLTVHRRAAQCLHDDAGQHRTVWARMQASTTNHQARAKVLANARFDECLQLPAGGVGM